MPEYIEREAAIETIKNLYPSMPLVKLNVDKWHEKNKAYMECEIAIERIPAADVVPVGAYNQAAWERDTAVEQLKQIGKSFGERMDDVRPVVRGKWEDVRVRDYSTNVNGGMELHIASMFCPVCGRWHNEVYHYGIATEMAHFCSNCGAEMREPPKEDKP